MMNLKTVLPTAVLAPPAISVQDFSAKFLVCFPIQLQARTFLAEHGYAGILR
jgi:hypothetical protein